MFDLVQLAAAVPATHPTLLSRGMPAEGFLELGTAKVAQFVTFLKVLVVAAALFVIIKEYLKRQSIGAAIGAIVTASLVIWGVNHITWGEAHVGDELNGSPALTAPAGGPAFAVVSRVPAGLGAVTDAGPVRGGFVTVIASGHAGR